MRVEDALKNAAKALADCTMLPTVYTPELVADLLGLENTIASTIEAAPQPLTQELYHRIDYVIEELDELHGALAEASRHDPLNRVMLTSAADGLRARWGFGYYSRH